MRLTETWLPAGSPPAWREESCGIQWRNTPKQAFKIAVLRAAVSRQEQHRDTKLNWPGKFKGICVSLCSLPTALESWQREKLQPTLLFFLLFPLSS